MLRSSTKARPIPIILDILDFNLFSFVVIPVSQQAIPAGETTSLAFWLFLSFSLSGFFHGTTPFLYNLFRLYLVPIRGKTVRRRAGEGGR
ncbi:hypothetical protein ES708_34805 [subsurface metagenome]